MINFMVSTMTTLHTWMSRVEERREWSTAKNYDSSISTSAASLPSFVSSPVVVLACDSWLA
jgi:hypothetical protein